MPVFNGLAMTTEAHKLALQVHALTGKEKLTSRDPVAGTVRSLLRKLYNATGGHRSSAPDSYAPTSDELREVYNGVSSGGEIHHRNTVGMPTVTVPHATVEVTQEVAAVAEAKATLAEPKLVVGDGPDEKAIEALKALLGSQKVDPEAIRQVALEAVDGRVSEVLSCIGSLIADEMSNHVKVTKIERPNLPPITVDKAHYALGDILLFVHMRKNVMIKGPAGCGKTYMAEQIANIEKIPYGFSGTCIDKTELLGYMDGGGTYRRTVFRDIWEFGGVFLCDEMDTWAPEALIAINAALSGDKCNFPDGIITKHADTSIIAATNTDGTGADGKYSAREVLDFASRNRFAFYEMDYDEGLELAITCDADWTKHIQKVRKAIRTVGGIEHDVTPRDSIGGGEMLAAGMDRAKVEEAYIWRGMKVDTKNRILAAIR